MFICSHHLKNYISEKYNDLATKQINLSLTRDFIC